MLNILSLSFVQLLLLKESKDISQNLTTHNSMKLVQELEQLIGMKRRIIFVLNTQTHSLMRTVFFFLKISLLHGNIQNYEIKMSSINMSNLLVPSLRGSNLSLRIPKVRLDFSKNNFVFNACMLWNNFEKILFSKIIPDGNGLKVPGSS